MATDETTMQALAREARGFMERAERKEGESYWRRKDSAPSWVEDLCMAAHGDMLPDDHRYEFIVEALDALVENEDEDDAADSLEADIYTHDLTGWLHSRTDRCGYIDQALTEYGQPDPNESVITMLQMGQLTEKREVFTLVRNFLEDMIEEIDSRVGGDDDED